MMIQEILRNIGKYIGVYIKKRIVINEHIYEHVRRLSLIYLSTHFRYFNCTLFFKIEIQLYFLTKATNIGESIFYGKFAPVDISNVCSSFNRVKISFMNVVPGNEAN